MPHSQNPYPPSSRTETERLPSLDRAPASQDGPAAAARPNPKGRGGLGRIGVPFLAALAGGAVALGGAGVTGNLGGSSDPAPITAPAPANLPSGDQGLPAAEGGAPAADSQAPEVAVDIDDGDALSASELVQRTAPGVVQVNIPGVGLGSGFLIDDAGHILTNQHVVEDAKQAQVEFDDGSTREAQVLGTDPTVDLAVLQVVDLPESAAPVPLGVSSGVIVGSPVIALGSPFGLERTATAGIVSAVKRRITSPNREQISNVIQTDAAINSGNSGGPLFDRRGRVIGMNSQIAAGAGGGNVGIGFAVPIDTLKPITEAIIETGEPEHAYVGIVGRPLTSDVAAQLGFGDLRGVIVVDLDEKGNADEAGLVPTELEGSDADERVTKEGDIITAADGTAVSDFDELIQVISAKAVGEEIALTVRRGDAEREVVVKLIDRPADAG